METCRSCSAIRHTEGHHGGLDGEEPSHGNHLNHAFAVISAWLNRYDAERPHSALGYLTPKEYREELAT